MDIIKNALPGTNLPTISDTTAAKLIRIEAEKAIQETKKPLKVCLFVWKPPIHTRLQGLNWYRNMTAKHMLLWTCGRPQTRYCSLLLLLISLRRILYSTRSYWIFLSSMGHTLVKLRPMLSSDCSGSLILLPRYASLLAAHEVHSIVIFFCGQIGVIVADNASNMDCTIKCLEPLFEAKNVAFSYEHQRLHCHVHIIHLVAVHLLSILQQRTPPPPPLVATTSASTPNSNCSFEQ